MVSDVENVSGIVTQEPTPLTEETLVSFKRKIAYTLHGSSRTTRKLDPNKKCRLWGAWLREYSPDINERISCSFFHSCSSTKRGEEISDSSVLGGKNHSLNFKICWYKILFTGWGDYSSADALHCTDRELWKHEHHRWYTMTGVGWGTDWRSDDGF